MVIWRVQIHGVISVQSVLVFIFLIVVKTSYRERSAVLSRSVKKRQPLVHIYPTFFCNNFSTQKLTTTTHFFSRQRLIFAAGCRLSAPEQRLTENDSPRADLHWVDPHCDLRRKPQHAGCEFTLFTGLKDHLVTGESLIDPNAPEKLKTWLQKII